MDPSQSAVALAELKAFLRVAHDEEDALIARLGAAATALCEAFTGQVPIARTIRERVAPARAWKRLGAAPVRAIEQVETVDGMVLPTYAYAIDIDARGDGWVRLTRGTEARMLIVTYVAGLAEAAADVPEPLRMGIARMAAHLYAERGAGEGAQPPAAIGALWRPWRRLSIAGGRGEAP
jgi:uncharacterized phiE125 gp8 family phage protein